MRLGIILILVIGTSISWAEKEVKPRPGAEKIEEFILNHDLHTTEAPKDDVETKNVSPSATIGTLPMQQTTPIDDLSSNGEEDKGGEVEKLGFGIFSLGGNDEEEGGEEEEEEDEEEEEEEADTNHRITKRFSNSITSHITPYAICQEEFDSFFSTGINREENHMDQNLILLNILRKIFKSGNSETAEPHRDVDECGMYKAVFKSLIHPEPSTEESGTKSNPNHDVRAFLRFALVQEDKKTRRKRSENPFLEKALKGNTDIPETGSPPSKEEWMAVLEKLIDETQPVLGKSSGIEFKFGPLDDAEPLKSKEPVFKINPENPFLAKIEPAKPLEQVKPKDPPLEKVVLDSIPLATISPSKPLESSPSKVPVTEDLLKLVDRFSSAASPDFTLSSFLNVVPEKCRAEFLEVVDTCERRLESLVDVVRKWRGN